MPPRLPKSRPSTAWSCRRIGWPRRSGCASFEAGGNAVDAAVAVGYALAVVDPCCGNIGGGGFMTVHLADGRETFINFRETAPAAASAGMYLDSEGSRSTTSAGMATLPRACPVR